MAEATAAHRAAGPALAQGEAWPPLGAPLKGPAAEDSAEEQVRPPGTSHKAAPLPPPRRPPPAPAAAPSGATRPHQGRLLLLQPVLHVTPVVAGLAGGGCRLWVLHGAEGFPPGAPRAAAAGRHQARRQADQPPHHAGTAAAGEPPPNPAPSWLGTPSACPASPPPTAAAARLPCTNAGHLRCGGGKLRPPGLDQHHGGPAAPRQGVLRGTHVCCPPGGAAAQRADPLHSRRRLLITRPFPRLQLLSCAQERAKEAALASPVFTALTSGLRHLHWLRSASWQHLALHAGGLPWLRQFVPRCCAAGLMVAQCHDGLFNSQVWPPPCRCCKLAASCLRVAAAAACPQPPTAPPSPPAVHRQRLVGGGQAARPRAPRLCGAGGGAGGGPGGLPGRGARGRPAHRAGGVERVVQVGAFKWKG